MVFLIGWARPPLSPGGVDDTGGVGSTSTIVSPGARWVHWVLLNNVERFFHQPSITRFLCLCPVEG